MNINVWHSHESKCNQRAHAYKKKEGTLYFAEFSHCWNDTCWALCIYLRNEIGAYRFKGCKVMPIVFTVWPSMSLRLNWHSCTCPEKVVTGSICCVFRSILFLIPILERPAVLTTSVFPECKPGQTLEQTRNKHCSRRGKHQLRSGWFWCQNNFQICLSQKEVMYPSSQRECRFCWGSRQLLGPRQVPVVSTAFVSFVLSVPFASSLMIPVSGLIFPGISLFLR